MIYVNSKLHKTHKVLNQWHVASCPVNKLLLYPVNIEWYINNQRDNFTVEET